MEHNGTQMDEKLHVKWMNMPYQIGWKNDTYGRFG
jgi:hypothetical protein